MKDDKHTPGPWEVSGPFQSDNASRWYCLLSRDCVSFIMVDGPTKEEALANAELIASAPTLKSELEQANKEIERLKGERKEIFNSNEFIQNVCLSYRHDFGMLTMSEKEAIYFECKEWMRAIDNNWDHFKSNGMSC